MARGAAQAGCIVASAYPGTPSTEILENIAKFKDTVKCEWAVNEKVAMETAIGASMAGARSLTAMKHVGLNVAMDPLMTFTYVGATGGMVVVTADDPGMHSSQNEQDNRNIAKFARAPMFEPSDSQEAYDMVQAAFETSEKYRVPCFLRLTTRTSHSSSLVDLGDFHPAPHPVIPYQKDITHTIPVPAFARGQRLAAQKREQEMARAASRSKFNRIEPGKKQVGIITSGVAYQYVKEIFPEFTILKLGWTNPFPAELVKKFAKTVRHVLVVEELDPFIESQVRALGIKVQSHKTELNMLELNPDRLQNLRHELLKDVPKAKAAKPDTSLPTRPPVLCAGCGHRGVFYVLHKLGATVTGDIGCYTLGAFPPLNAMDSTICMGASIGNAAGMRKAGLKGRICAVLGDSTFFHSGLTGILSAHYNGTPVTTVVLDNRITAMREGDGLQEGRDRERGRPRRAGEGAEGRDGRRRGSRHHRLRPVPHRGEAHEGGALRRRREEVQGVRRVLQDGLPCDDARQGDGARTLPDEDRPVPLRRLQAVSAGLQVRRHHAH